MATLNVIRRWALREQMSIREISRRTGLSRNTVKKYLRSDEAEPAYVRRVGPSKLDLYAEKLTTWLETEVTKSRKQRRNLKQIYTHARSYDLLLGLHAAFDSKMMCWTLAFSIDGIRANAKNNHEQKLQASISAARCPASLEGDFWMSQIESHGGAMQIEQAVLAWCPMT